MKTATKNSTNQKSLLTEAFSALLGKMGREKTLRVWQVLVPSHESYLEDIRPKLFEGIDAKTLDKELKKFNRKPRSKG